MKNLPFYFVDIDNDVSPLSGVQIRPTRKIYLTKILALLPGIHSVYISNVNNNIVFYDYMIKKPHMIYVRTTALDSFGA